MSQNNEPPLIIRNEWFYAVARISTLFATFVGLPLAGFLLSRVVAQADHINDQLLRQNIEFRVLSATVNEKLNTNVSTLADHELRLRSLEKTK